MKKSHVVLVSVIAVLAFACVALAVPPAPPGPPGPPMGPFMGPPPPHDFAMGGPEEGPIGMLKEELGMTDQQKKQLRMLHAGFLDRTRKARMALIGLKDEHRAMMMTGAPDLKKLAQLDEQEVKLVSEIMAERFKMRRDRLAVLTAEQVEKLSALMADKRLPHKMHRGHGRDQKDAPEEPGR